MAGAEIFNKPDKRPFVVGGVALGTLLAVTGIYDSLTTYLLWLGILIPPLGGVIIGDWLRTWRHGVPAPATHAFPVLRWANLAAYALGAVTGWGTGQAGWGIPPVNGVVVAVLGVFVFGLASRRRPTTSEASGAAARKTEAAG